MTDGSSPQEHESDPAGSEQERTCKERLKFLLEATSDGLYDWDIATGEVFFSPGYYTMLGYPPGGFPSTFEGWRQRVHPEDLPGVEAVIALQFQGSGKPCNVEFRMRTRDGDWRWILSRGKVVAWNPDGSPARMVGSHTDIHDRKMAEERFRLLFENLDSAFALHEAVYSPEGRVVDLRWLEINPAYERMFALKAEAIIGRTIREISPEVEDYWINAYEQVVLEGVPIHFENFSKIFGRWFESWAYRPAPGMLAILLSDVTLRKETEQRLKNLASELEQRVEERTRELMEANQELESFTYSVSHDLRAPLRAMDGFSRILLEDHGSLLPQEGRRTVDMILQSAHRMSGLIDDLLRLSRMGRTPLVIQTVDMESLFREAASELGISTPGMMMKSGPLPPCEGDSSLLKQVWINLLSNALKFSRNRNPVLIQVGYDEVDGVPAYFVRDNGAGFDMKYVHKLFNVFQRLHRQEEFEGTGVGLALTRQIIARHGGRIWAESSPGEGACFRFSLSNHSKGAAP